jgi:very-short-patch-repair endonuclease
MRGQTNPSILRPKLQRRLRLGMTAAEQMLWLRLRMRQIEGCKFRRQHPFGEYILDFVCLERKLVVELDGGQHAETAERDAKRTAWLESAGFIVLRFWNNLVFLEMEGVLQVIREGLMSHDGSMGEKPIPTQPSP